MLLKAFDKYITELMYAEVYFPSAGNMRACVFNRFRSRRQYIYSWLQLSQQVLTELNKTGLPCHHWQYVTVRLQEAGKNFISENGRIVLHRNILVYRCGVAVGVAELDVQSRHILAAYLSVQYSAWVEMCSLCESFFSVYRGNYLWQGKEIELLELCDALWVSERVRPLAAERTKKQYFRRLFGFFNLPLPDDPCHRLGEISLRARPDLFLSWLHDNYLVYWEDREV